MNSDSTYYTFNGYRLHEDEDLTPALEDYLEMIYRLSRSKERIRILGLSQKLNVKPSSSSKMVKQLSKLGYLTAERYGSITLTDKGTLTGSYLLYRHGVIHSFLCKLNGSDNELAQAEKIEHFLSRKTVENLSALLEKLYSE